MLKKSPSPPPRPSRTVLNRILGCKWTTKIFRLMRDGIHRPGALEKRIPGLSTKVLSECLGEKIRLGLVEKRIFAEVPPRVEYHFTEFGQRFILLLAEIEAFQTEIDRRAMAEKP